MFWNCWLSTTHSPKTPTHHDSAWLTFVKRWLIMTHRSWRFQKVPGQPPLILGFLMLIIYYLHPQRRRGCVLITFIALIWVWNISIKLNDITITWQIKIVGRKIPSLFCVHSVCLKCKHTELVSRCSKEEWFNQNIRIIWTWRVTRCELQFLSCDSPGKIWYGVFN